MTKILCLGAIVLALAAQIAAAQTRADERGVREAIEATAAGFGNRDEAATLPPGIQGAWRLVETAFRAPGGAWETQPSPQGGLFVFTARHYSYFYVRGSDPRTRFAEANKPTQAEKAAAYDSIIAGAGSYTFEGDTLIMRADFRKNPNEMTGEPWRWHTVVTGDTAQFVFVNPPFRPGHEWRLTIARVE